MTPLLMTIAWRNIWRNRRRTLINMSAVGLGLSLVIVYTGLVDGILGDAKNQLGNTGMGHVEIYAPLWRGNHRAGEVLGDPSGLVSRLRLPRGSRVAARVVARGLAATAHAAQGVVIHGIDPGAEASVATYAGDVRQGVALPRGDRSGIVIGEELAARLKVRVGQKVRLTVQRADGEIGADLFRVRGIFHSIAPSISRGRVLITTGSAQTLLGVGDAAHEVVIQLGRAEDSEPLAAALRSELGSGYDVATYGDLLPVMKAMDRLVTRVAQVAALFVYVLAGLGVLNTMLMSVLERTRELGVMRALGNRPGDIVSLVLAEAFWIASVSVVLGLGLGLAVNYLGSQVPLLDLSTSVGESLEVGGTVLKSSFRTEFSWLSGFEAAGMVYALTLLAGLYPAWRISRLRPAEALRAV